MPTGGAPDDHVLTAMGELVGALRRFSSQTDEILAALDRAAGQRDSGATYNQIAKEGGMFVGFSSGALRDLLDAVSEFRRAQASALYAEGLTMVELGRLLGVTRQRVAVLLDAEKRAKR
jgi:hypothetical protein